MAVAVLHSAESIGRYTAYVREVLHSEGLVDVRLLSVNALSPDLDVDRYQAVVVGRGHLSPAIRQSLLEYASAGGNVIVIQPSRAFLTDLGLTPRDTVVERAYVHLTESSVTRGIAGHLLQCHGPADRWSAPAEAEVVMRIAEEGTPHGCDPAVVRLRRGSGWISVYSFDPGRAIAFVRQGDPALVGTRSMGEASRMMDYILATADPQCWSVPQADLHAALLVNLVTAGSADPVLRWWYYPSANQTSALVLDSDDDWSAQSAFNALIDAVERLDGHVTMYLMMGPTTGSVLTPEQVQTWRERGHSFGIHHDHYDAVYTGRDEAEIFPGNLEADLVAFAGRYTGRPRVNRNHCLGWVGYVETAKFWAEQGIVMDSNVGSYGESWGGYVAGTGRPLRFVDEDGTVVDCFQQPHLVYDDLTVLERLRDDTEAEVARMVAWIDEIATTWYHPFVVLSHPVSFEGYSARFQVAVWTAAVERGLPFWSMEEWADFVAARDGFRLEPCEGGSRVRAPHALGCATLAVPAGQHAPHVVVDGVEVDGVRRDVLGQEYLLVTVPDGAIVSLGQTGQQR